VAAKSDGPHGNGQLDRAGRWTAAGGRVAGGSEATRMEAGGGGAGACTWEGKRASGMNFYSHWAPSKYTVTYICRLTDECTSPTFVGYTYIFVGFKSKEYSIFILLDTEKYKKKLRNVSYSIFDYTSFTLAYSFDWYEG
jgi:hypothetical protein